MPRKAKNVPMNETPAQRFVRLANQRVNRILVTFKQLGQLGGSAYASSPEQVRKIAEVLKAAHDRSVDQLQKKEVASGEFKL